MIYITQGHAKGIGIEVFLKAFICLKSSFQDKFKLIISKFDLELNLKQLNIEYSIKNDELSYWNTQLQCLFFEKDSLPNSSISLDLAMGLCKPNDILLTLPTSKDQLFFKTKQVNGHTEYFRKAFNLEEIAMTFLGEDSNFLLLSDHIAIQDVPTYLSEDFIFNKVSIALKNFPQNREIKEVFFAGINPHCGEDGHISNDDIVIDKVTEKLKKTFPNIIFHKQQAGDTLHFNIKNKHQLFIYPAHDQGLAPFKLKYGLTGINFSQGLPFPRVSVDHGTAFNLWGKNQANYIGMLYLLHEIESWT